MTKTTESGYCPCACRDCMEIAIGEPGAMCHECEDSGCEGDAECLRPEVFGDEECEDNACTGCAWCEAVNPPPCRIAELCLTEGSYPIARLSEDPADVLPRLLAVLHELAPAPVSVPAIPAAALTDGRHPAWDGGIAEVALLAIIVALNAHAPEGFALIVEGESIGFYPLAGEGI
jgi:hypothetical protein